MNIRQAAYTLAIVRNKTMHKAAQELYVTEATISQQVRQFERELGIVLFDRSRRALCPTDACWKLLPDFERLVGAHDVIATNARLLREGIMKSAKFVPLSGYLLCPNCGERITASNGVSCLHDTAGQKWEKMSHEKWQCMKCHQRFALPRNPFRAESEVQG